MSGRVGPFHGVATLLLALAVPHRLDAQALLGRTPNLVDPSPSRQGATFVLAHRFEFLGGGDELINVPALGLQVALPLGLTAGLDYTSNSETTDAHAAGNEAQYWLRAHRALGPRAVVALTAAYNGVARSTDGAATARVRVGPLALLGELRGFSDRWGTGESGAAAAGGALLFLTPRLALTGDVGRAFDADTSASVWSAGIALAIPGSPHTLSFVASNTGATSLQSASRPKRLGPEDVRWGFAFSIPLGTRAQWAQLFRRGEPTATLATSGDTVRVPIRTVAFAIPELRVKRGQVVEWVNADPIEHTATADDGSWDSGPLKPDARWSRRFETPGRFTYHCTPHPQMKAVVIVE